ncbi:hypothetical protein K443DRAFT_413736 [Laccaria amethystina LaAM-08-1]|uniref:Uncharacterized protein n=1 Tax=Laccaria amethystina LaAM-08-1 TaxID=1095629 RepID=A0A0C9X9U2_9AGAR|nr:hypothetical protein K443DRAFT_413736 [Laccaria amethystina LaAM-08-1]
MQVRVTRHVQPSVLIYRITSFSGDLSYLYCRFFGMRRAFAAEVANKHDLSYYQSPTRNVTSSIYHLVSPRFETADRLVFIDIDQG